MPTASQSVLEENKKAVSVACAPAFDDLCQALSKQAHCDKAKPALRRYRGAGSR